MSGCGAKDSAPPPLEARFAFAPNRPIDIAQMVIQNGVCRHQFDCTLHDRHGFVVAAQTVIGPAKAIDNVAAIRLRFDRALDHPQRLVQFQPFVDQRITQVVQHLRLVGHEFQNTAEFRLCALPLAQTFQRDRAGV